MRDLSHRLREAHTRTIDGGRVAGLACVLRITGLLLFRHPFIRLGADNHNEPEQERT